MVSVATVGTLWFVRLKFNLTKKKKVCPALNNANKKLLNTDQQMASLSIGHVYKPIDSENELYTQYRLIPGIEKMVSGTSTYTDWRNDIGSTECDVSHVMT